MVHWAGSHDNQSTEEVKKLMSTLCSKYKRKDVGALASSTLEDKVADGRFPVGGLEEVETAVMEAYARVIVTDIKSIGSEADKKSYYLYFLSVLMTAICVRVSQGRMQVPSFNIFSLVFLF